MWLYRLMPVEAREDNNLTFENQLLRVRDLPIMDLGLASPS